MEQQGNLIQNLGSQVAIVSSTAEDKNHASNDKVKAQITSTNTTDAVPKKTSTNTDCPEVKEEKDDELSKAIQKLPQRHNRGLMSTLLTLGGTEVLNRKPDPLPLMQMKVEPITDVYDYEYNDEDYIEYGITQDMLDEANIEAPNFTPEEVGTRIDSSMLLCKMCQAQTTSIGNFRDHLNGKSHKSTFLAYKQGRVLKKPVGKNKRKAVNIPISELGKTSVVLETVKNVKDPVLGLSYVTEFHSAGCIICVCNLCMVKFDNNCTLAHMAGIKHKLHYLKWNKPVEYAHVKKYSKRSKLSQFLDELSIDIEKKDGRGTPLIRVFDPDKIKKSVDMGEKMGDGDEDRKRLKVMTLLDGSSAISFQNWVDREIEKEKVTKPEFLYEEDLIVEEKVVPPNLYPSPLNKQPGSQNMHPGHPNMQRGPQNIQLGPPNMQRGPPNMQRGPPNIQLGPPNMQHGPPNMQHGPPNMQRGPPNIQLAPPNMQHGPPNIQPGLPNIYQGPPNMYQGLPNMYQGPLNMYQRPTHMLLCPTNMYQGPPNRQPCPPNMNPGPPNMNLRPSTMNLGPSNMNIGPPNMNLGPPNMNLGPSNMNLGPPNMDLAPPNMNIGPPNMNMGPPNMQPGPQNIYSGSQSGTLNMCPGPQNMYTKPLIMWQGPHSDPSGMYTGSHLETFHTPQPFDLNSLHSYLAPRPSDTNYNGPPESRQTAKEIDKLPQNLDKDGGRMEVEFNRLHHGSDDNDPSTTQEVDRYDLVLDSDLVIKRDPFQEALKRREQKLVTKPINYDHKSSRKAKKEKPLKSKSEKWEDEIQNFLFRTHSKAATANHALLSNYSSPENSPSPPRLSKTNKRNQSKCRYSSKVSKGEERQPNTHPMSCSKDDDRYSGKTTRDHRAKRKKNHEESGPREEERQPMRCSRDDDRYSGKTTRDHRARREKSLEVSGPSSKMKSGMRSNSGGNRLSDSLGDQAFSGGAERYLRECNPPNNTDMYIEHTSRRSPSSHRKTDRTSDRAFIRPKSSSSPVHVRKRFSKSPSRERNKQSRGRNPVQHAEQQRSTGTSSLKKTDAGVNRNTDEDEEHQAEAIANMLFKISKKMGSEATPESVLELLLSDPTVTSTFLQGNLTHEASTMKNHSSPSPPPKSVRERSPLHRLGYSVPQQDCSVDVSQSSRLKFKSSPRIECTVDLSQSSGQRQNSRPPRRECTVDVSQSSIPKPYSSPPRRERTVDVSQSSKQKPNSRLPQSSRQKPNSPSPCRDRSRLASQSCTMRSNSPLLQGALPTSGQIKRHRLQKTRAFLADRQSQLKQTNPPSSKPQKQNISFSINKSVHHLLASLLSSDFARGDEENSE